MIYVTGDTHGEMNKFSNKNAPYLQANDIIIICGDFGGIWDGSKREKYWLDWLASKEQTFCFVDGNHENFDLLHQYPTTLWNSGYVHLVKENVIHLMRGQIYTIENKSFFTMGGASSHDIQGGILELDDPLLKSKMRKLNKKQIPYRINRHSWWVEELPSKDELAEGIIALELVGWQVDYIISHCAPTSIQHQIDKPPYMYETDRLNQYFEEIKDKCDFKHWYFGHYHQDQSINDKFTLVYDKLLPLN